MSLTLARCPSFGCVASPAAVPPLYLAIRANPIPPPRRRTDIEQEANGLYTFDRREKLDADRVKKVMDEAVQMFYRQRPTA